MTELGALLGSIVALLSQAATAAAEERGPAAILELGGAGEWSLKDGGSSFGPAAAVEVTPIENWLEIEGGVTPLVAAHHTEWDTDLLFKKPFALSETVEFMAGVGPEWAHTTGARKAADSVAGEAALDVMICRGRSAGSAGTWSRATATISAGATSSRSPPASAC